MRKRIGLIGKVIVVIFALYAALLMISLQAQINERKAEGRELQEKVNTQALINAALQEDIGYDGSVNTDSRIARIARERIGLVAPGEIIIINKTP